MRYSGDMCGLKDSRGWIDMAIYVATLGVCIFAFSEMTVTADTLATDWSPITTGVIAGMCMYGVFKAARLYVRFGRMSEGVDLK